MDEVHLTEADGLEATWRSILSDDRKIEIMKVHNTSGAQSDVTFVPGTDLVAARERFPALGALWDQVCAEFWAWLSPPAHRSTDCGVRWWD